jgi:hypothetical protein
MLVRATGTTSVSWGTHFISYHDQGKLSRWSRSLIVYESAQKYQISLLSPPKKDTAEELRGRGLGGI